MIGRREILMGLLGAPAVGKGVLAKAASAVPTGAVLGATRVGEVCSPPTPQNPVVFAARRHIERMQEAQRQRTWAGERAMRGELPPHIGANRSWSLAYKAHVVEAEARATQMNTYDLDEEAILKIAKVMGFSE